MEHLLQAAVVGGGVHEELLEREADRLDLQVERAGLDLGDVAVVLGAIDGPELHDVAGPEEHHEVLQVRLALGRVEDRRRRDAEHLVAARAAHRVDAAEAAAVADGELRRVGAGPQVLRRLDLPLPLHHLEEERQPRHEPDHRDEPGRARVRRDELLHGAVVVHARGVLEVGRLGVLVPLAEAHEGLARPGVVVEDRDLDDARVELELGLADHGLERLEHAQEVVRLHHLGPEADLVRGVRRADLGDARDREPLHGARDRHALEERLERHLLAELDEDVLVPAERVACWS
jgi:hypothetical protein